MPRTKLVNGKRIPLTKEEEHQRDADEHKMRTNPPRRTVSEIQVLCEALNAKGIKITEADREAARTRLMQP